MDPNRFKLLTIENFSLIMSSILTCVNYQKNGVTWINCLLIEQKKNSTLINATQLINCRCLSVDDILLAYEHEIYASGVTSL